MAQVGAMLDKRLSYLNLPPRPPLASDKRGEVEHAATPILTMEDALTSNGKPNQVSPSSTGAKTKPAPKKVPAARPATAEPVTLVPTPGPATSTSAPLNQKGRKEKGDQTLATVNSTPARPRERASIRPERRPLPPPPVSMNEKWTTVVKRGRKTKDDKTNHKPTQTPINQANLKQSTPKQ